MALRLLELGVTEKAFALAGGVDAWRAAGHALGPKGAAAATQVHQPL